MPTAQTHTGTDPRETTVRERLEELTKETAELLDVVDQILAVLKMEPRGKGVEGQTSPIFTIDSILRGITYISGRTREALETLVSIVGELGRL